MRRYPRCVVLLGVLLGGMSVFVNVPQAVAQTVTGTILGTVRDPQGAVVPSASVSARNLETGAERTVVSDASGGYSIVSIPAGSYEVTASASGFRTDVRSGMTLTVGASLRVDFTLSVGAVAERVEVTGEAPQVDTTTSTMGGLVADTVIRELPLNGRDWLQLAVLQPGVASVVNGQFGVTRGLGARMSISGGRTSANVYRVDGVVANDPANNSPGSALGGNMGVDAIREFSVLTNTYSAEYGRGSGGVINAITKSGTNDFHGTAFYFHRNSALEARNFFDGATTPPFRRHQLGASVGGPIQQNKLFFFSNYEGLREFLNVRSSSDTLSLNARNGTLCANRDCTRTTTVPIDPRVRPYLVLYPLPNLPSPGDTGRFENAAGRIATGDFGLGKIDYQLSPNTMLVGSYTIDDAERNAPDALNLKLSGGETRTQRAILSLQHVFSPTVLNTIRGGTNRVVQLVPIESAISPLLNDLSLGFMPGQYLGSLRVTGLNDIAGVYASGYNHVWYTAPQLNDDLAWVKGRHNIRIGFSVEAIRMNHDNSPSFPGRWAFGSIQDFLTLTNPLSFEAELPESHNYNGLRTKIFGVYIQDDFRLRPNLTLNLGLRYEPATVITDINGEVSSLRNLTDREVTIGNPLFQNPTLRNFGPRVGFAWDPSGTGKTAIRSGFGIFSMTPLPNTLLQRTSGMYPFLLGGTLPNPSGSIFPNGAVNVLTPTDTDAFSVEYEPSASYKMQWNLNIQRQIAGGVNLMAGYVGARAVHLLITFSNTNTVPPHLLTVAPDGHLVFPATRPVPVLNPNWSGIGRSAWHGWSTYHGLQVGVSKQMSRGITFQSAYAWQKSMDIASQEVTNTELRTGVESPYPLMPHLQRSVSDFDVPHRLSVNFLWDVPSPQSQLAVSRFLLSGWELSGIFQAQAGAPTTIRFTPDRAGTGITGGGGPGAGSNQRPDFVPGPGCSSPNAVNPGNPDVYVKLECFVYPAPNTLGNVGRNTLRGPGLVNFDFSLFKNHTLLDERLQVQFRAEFFNLFNRTNHGMQRVTGFDRQGRAVATSARLVPPTATTSRQIQFGMRLIW